MPDIYPPDLPKDEASKLVEDIRGRALDFRSHCMQNLENNRQLMEFWSGQLETIDNFLRGDDLQRMATVRDEDPMIDYNTDADMMIRQQKLDAIRDREEIPRWRRP